MSYPDLFRPPGSDYYYFRCEDPATGRRRWKPTRTTTKSDAWDMVRDFFNQSTVRVRGVTFAQYSES